MLSSRWFNRYFVYPAAVLLRGEQRVFRAQRRLSAMDRWTPQQLKQHQIEKLGEALRYAAEHCTYYRERWPLTRDFSAPDRLIKTLPLLTKADLQTHAAALTAQPRVRASHKTTGGSTGEAVTLLKDGNAIAQEMAASWQAYGWFGVKRGDRAVRFWGAPFNMKRKLRFMAADIAMNRLRFSAFAFSDADLSKYWQECVKFKPDYIYGYTSMLLALAHFLRAREIDGRALPLKAIISTSEVLGSVNRDFLAQTFGCPVQDEYGCGEVGPIAYSCEENLLHLMSDNVYVELLREDGSDAAAGELAELVVTDLNNRAMPLIRYRISDFAVAATSCACGRPYPVLERVVGRAYDFVQGPDGRRFHGEFFMYLFEDMRREGLGFDQFQVIQYGPSSLQIDVVASGEPSPAQHEYIQNRLAPVIPGLQLELRRVPQIRREKSGKLRVILNRSQSHDVAVDVAKVSMPGVAG